MLYFDIRPCLKRLSNEQLGELFMSIMDYGEFGNVPDFQDQLIGMAWDIIQQRLDNDDMRYKEKCEKAAKSVKARWGKEKQKDEHTNVYERIETYADEHSRIRENTKQCEDIRIIPTTTSYSTTKSTPSTHTPQKTDLYTQIDAYDVKAKYKPTWFEEFYNRYPKKVGKAVAAMEWDKLQPNDSLCKVMSQALEQHKRSEQWQDERMIPNLDRWIREKRWTDELKESKKDVKEHDDWFN